MLRIRIHAAAVFAALALAAGGCSGAPSLPPLAESTLEFSYTGDRTGVFSTRGELSAPVATHDYATAGIADRLTLQAARFHGALVDYFQLVGYVTRAGTYELGFVEPGKPAAAITFDYDNSGRPPADIYDFRSGTLVVEHISADRVRGRFEGRAVTWDGRAITVTDGRFDVSVKDLDPLNQ